MKGAGEMLPWIKQAQQAGGSEFEFPALTKMPGMSLHASNSRVGGEVETDRSQELPSQLAQFPVTSDSVTELVSRQ